MELENVPLGGAQTLPNQLGNLPSNQQTQKPTVRNIYEQSISDLLNSLTVGDVVTPKDILVVQARENVATLLQRLRDNRLRCAVVYDTEKLFLGFVDAFDVVTHVFNVTGWKGDISTETFQLLDWQAQKFAAEASGSIINISNADPFETITLETRLKEALDLLSRGIHRLAVVENGVLLNILSQWDILMLVLARISFLGTAVEKTLTEAKLVADNFNLMYSVPEDAGVVDALKYLNDNCISGVPLTDRTGKITGNFSVTDVLNLTFVNFPLLTLPINEFLFRIYGFVKPPVVCHKTDTVENVLLKFACFGIHRVYVVDESFRPIAVITLTDIMQFLLRADTRLIPTSE